MPYTPNSFIAKELHIRLGSSLERNNRQKLDMLHGIA